MFGKFLIFDVIHLIDFFQMKNCVWGYVKMYKYEAGSKTKNESSEAGDLKTI